MTVAVLAVTTGGSDLRAKEIAKNDQFSANSLMVSDDASVSTEQSWCKTKIDIESLDFSKTSKEYLNELRNLQDDWKVVQENVAITNSDLEDLTAELAQKSKRINVHSANLANLESQWSFKTEEILKIKEKLNIRTNATELASIDDFGVFEETLVRDINEMHDLLGVEGEAVKDTFELAKKYYDENVLEAWTVLNIATEENYDEALKQFNEVNNIYQALSTEAYKANESYIAGIENHSVQLGLYSEFQDLRMSDIEHKLSVTKTSLESDSLLASQLVEFIVSDGEYLKELWRQCLETEGLIKDVMSR